MEKIETTRTILGLGNKITPSKAITLPKEIKDVVVIGRQYIFRIEVIELVEEKKVYQCKECCHKSQVQYYCPVCNLENIEEVFE